MRVSGYSTGSSWGPSVHLSQYPKDPVSDGSEPAPADPSCGLAPSPQLMGATLTKHWGFFRRGAGSGVARVSWAPGSGPWGLVASHALISRSVSSLPHGDGARPHGGLGSGAACLLPECPSPESFQRGLLASVPRGEVMASVSTPSPTGQVAT